MAKANKKNNEATTATTEAAEVETVETTATDGQPEAAETNGQAEAAEVDGVALLETFKTETLPAIVEKHGTNLLEIMKATEAASRDFAGDKMKAERLALLAAGLDMDIETINPNKAGTTMLSAMFFNIHQVNTGQLTDIGENVRDKIAKKATDNTPTESETALVTTFAAIEQASDEMRSLSVLDLNKIQSSVMACFHVAMKQLGTKEFPFPRQCSDFLSFIIAASNGSTSWFKCSDAFIAETSGISAKTIARGRERLVQFMKDTGKGIVSIKAESGQPTYYKVNLLETVSVLVHGLINSGYSTESMLAVAGVSGRLLTESTDKIRTEVSDADLAAAKSLNNELSEAVDSLPKPEIVMADATLATKQAGYKKRFDSLREELGTALEQAHDAGLEKTVERLQTLAKDAQAATDAFDATKAEPNFEPLEKGLNAAKIEIAEAGRGKVAEAQAQAEAERAEAGEVSPETRRTVAQASIEATADVEAEAANSFESFSQAAFLLAEANAEPEAKQAAYLKCLEILNMAFQMQQYKAEA